MFYKALQLFFENLGRFVLGTQFQRAVTVLESIFILFQLFLSRCSPKVGLEDKIFVGFNLLEKLDVFDHVGAILDGAVVLAQLDVS